MAEHAGKFLGLGPLLHVLQEYERPAAGEACPGRASLIGRVLCRLQYSWYICLGAFHISPLTTAGLLTGACTNPIWVVKTRMLERGANHPEAYKSMWGGLKHVYVTRGLKGLWAGFIPSTLGVAHGAVQFALYEKMKHRRGEQIGGQQNLSNWDYIYMSGGSKLMAGAITYPYQPIRARMQQYDAANKYSGLIDVIRKTYTNEGFLAFYKG